MPLAPSPSDTAGVADPSASDREPPDEVVDDIIDLTDRRRVLLHAVFGVQVPPPAADEVFATPAAGVSAPR